MKHLTKLFSLIILLAFAISCSNEEADPQMNITVSNFSATIDEEPPVGEVIGQISATISEGTLSYSIVSQSPEGAFSIDPNDGIITVDDNTLFDFETAATVTGTIRVSGAGDSVDVSVTINLNDIDELTLLTIWKSEKLVFTKQNGADPGLEANQDRMTDNVWITRGNNGGQIYNAKTETAALLNPSPADTEWAYGLSEEIAGLEFRPFREAVGDIKEIVGKDMVLHLISDDIYIDIKFTSWSQGKVGGFSYERSTEE